MQAGLLALTLAALPIAPPALVEEGLDPPELAAPPEGALAPPAAAALPPLRVRFMQSREGGSATTSPDKLVLEGVLQRQALGRSDGEDAVLYRFDDVRVTAEGGREALPAAMLEAPFVARYDAGGRLRGVAFSPAVTTHVRDALHRAVAGLQLVSPDAAALQAGEWEATLDEPRHRARVRFRVAQTDDGILRFDRSLLAKEKRKSGPSQRSRYEVRSSSGRVDWSVHEHAVVAVTIDDIVELFYRGSHGYQQRTHLVASVASRETPARGALPTTLEAARELLEGERAQRLVYYRMSLDEVRKARAHSLGSAMATFLETVDEKPSEAAALLKDYVRLHPEQSAAVAEHANRMPHTEENLTRVGFVYAALASAGHEEAQRAIAAALSERRFNAMNKDRAARATLSLKRPERFVEPALWSYRESLDTASQARRQHKALVTNLYGALGGFEHGEPATTRVVVERLLAEYAAAGDPVQASVLLPALGNTGDFTTLWPVFEPLFEHESPVVRRRAYYVFQKAYTSEAFALFAAHYAGEEDLTVRLAASAIVEVMPRIPERLEWALDESQLTRDPVVLGRLVRIIGDELKSSPRTRPTLMALLQEPIDDETRGLIYRYVAPAGQGGAQ